MFVGSDFTHCEVFRRYGASCLSLMLCRTALNVQIPPKTLHDVKSKAEVRYSGQRRGWSLVRNGFNGDPDLYLHRNKTLMVADGKSADLKWL